MGATKSLDEINAVLTQFSENVDEIRNSPQDVEEAFREAAKWAATAEGASLFGVLGGVAGYAYGSLTEDDFTGSMQENKEEIKRKIQELLEKLQSAVDGLKAPVAFVQVSEEWLNLQTEVNQARNWVFTQTDLRTTWSGQSADAHFAAQQLQVAATDTASGICDTVSKALRDVADLAWEFYSTLVSDITGFLVDLTAALAKIATGVGAPWGVSDAIDALASIIKKVVDYGLNLGKTLISERGQVTIINSAIDNPKSFHLNKWPQIDEEFVSIDRPNGEKWSAK
ncbi:hypothetical protein [Nocardia amamiensis]|uniref:hypothetical protein n=1 Tax=Nocardia amamiensis TaxID=404578 RepID=UPI0008316C37|nr:hypothetical protein [Nocardia amamiensis]